MEEIGTNIRLLRKTKNITQEELANALHISYQAISKWENGSSQPDIALLPAIANYFGVSIDELFGFKLQAILTAKTSAPTHKLQNLENFLLTASARTILSLTAL